MTRFQRRRSEVLGNRQRRPRRRDIEKQRLARYRAGARRRVRTMAANRLAIAMEGFR